MAAFHHHESDLRIASKSQEDPFIVKKRRPGSGFGLVADGNSFREARETVLWIRKSWGLSLETSKLQGRCYQCLRTDTSNAENENQQTNGAGAEATLKSCVGCHTVKYCGKKCQSRSWKEHHKYECMIYSALQPRVLPSPVRAVIRLLKQRANGYLTGDEWTNLLSLESHQDDLSYAGGQRWQDIFLMAKAVQKYSATKESFDVVLRICCIIAVNSFTLTDAVLEPLGMIFDPMAAMLNHSCEPNCIVRFDTDRFDPTLEHTSRTDPILGSIAVDILRPIKDGEELTISYIDNTFPLAKRQSDLSSRYFFTCDCSRCVRGINTPFDKLLMPSLSPLTAEAEAYAIKVLDSAASKPNNLQLMIPTIRSALTRLCQAAAFPIHRYPYAQLRLQLILGLIASRAWYEAMLQSAILVYRIDPILHTEPHHPIRIVNKWRLYRLARHLCVDMFGAKTIPAVSKDEEMKLKMTVVVTIMTLQFDRPKMTVPMPRSILDNMLTQARAGVMRADLLAEGRLDDYNRPGLFDGALNAHQLAPKRVEETLKEEWDVMIDDALREEREHDANPDELTEEAQKLAESLSLSSEATT